MPSQKVKPVPLIPVMVTRMATLVTSGTGLLATVDNMTGVGGEAHLENRPT